ncbi:hypothetical protein HOE425_331724 [Hoeflea sp. EC-HK425]|nr:hypothetical protein HOE425_331724 [Hoeflea sp. EC-HK425]
MQTTTMRKLVSLPNGGVTLQIKS